MVSLPSRKNGTDSHQLNSIKETGDKCRVDEPLDSLHTATGLALIELGVHFIQL